MLLVSKENICVKSRSEHNIDRAKKTIYNKYKKILIVEQRVIRNSLNK